MATPVSGSVVTHVQGPAAPVVTAVSVSQTSDTIGPGGSTTYTARLNSGALTSLPPGATIAWSSSAASVETVPSSGDSGNPLQATGSAIAGGVPTGGETDVTITATVTQ